MTLIQYIVPQQTTKYKRAPHKNCYTKLSFKFIGIFPLTYAFVYSCHGNTFHIFSIRLQTFFSILLVFLHFLKAVFPRVPHLSAANYVVKKSLHRKKPSTNISTCCAIRFIFTSAFLYFRLQFSIDF